MVTAPSPAEFQRSGQCSWGCGDSCGVLCRAGSWTRSWWVPSSSGYSVILECLPCPEKVEKRRFLAFAWGAASSASLSVIPVIQSGVFNNWRGQRAALVVGGVQRKAGAVSIKIRALSEAAHKTKEMPLTSHFLTLEAPNPSCGISPAVTLPGLWLLMNYQLYLFIYLPSFPSWP